MNDFGFEYTEPQHWVCRHGCPSAVGIGMPSYESEDGQLQVFDFLLAQSTIQGAQAGLMLFSRWYGMAAMLAPDDMVPLHHARAAWWAWRPVVWRLNAFAGWQALGSQQELGWRFGLMEATHNKHTGSDFTFIEAEMRAVAILQEHLSPQQRIELYVFGWFRCRGGATGNVYKVEPGNGFAIVDPRTNEEVVSYCLHTEGWVPNHDLALATLLALEDRDLEVECLENARMFPRQREQRATRGDVVAARLERELVPKRRELVMP